MNRNEVVNQQEIIQETINPKEEENMSHTQLKQDSISKTEISDNLNIFKKEQTTVFSTDQNTEYFLSYFINLF
jgi:hypothetical protein